MQTQTTKAHPVTRIEAVHNALSCVHTIRALVCKAVRMGAGATDLQELLGAEDKALAHLQAVADGT